jgi:hypothetical protein
LVKFKNKTIARDAERDVRLRTSLFTTLVETFQKKDVKTCDQKD